MRLKVNRRKMSVAPYLLLFLSSLFVSAFSQYGGYPYYPYHYGGGYQPYPVSRQSYHRPCRTSCGNVQPTSYCPYSRCNRQQSYYSPYYSPYPYYNSKTYPNTYANPFVNYFASSRKASDPNSYSYPSINYLNPPRKSSDPFANIPVEIIDDDSVPEKKTTFTSNNQDKYANVPVEIIDVEDFDDFVKDIPVLPKSNRSPDTNYSVSHGEVTSNTVTQNKPVRATITRSFQPIKKNPFYRIDFLNGVPINSTGPLKITTGGEESSNVEPTTESPDTTVEPIPETTTEVNEVTEEDEDVAPVKSWGFFN